MRGYHSTPRNLTPTEEITTAAYVKKDAAVMYLEQAEAVIRQLCESLRLNVLTDAELDEAAKLEGLQPLEREKAMAIVRARRCLPKIQRFLREVA